MEKITDKIAALPNDARYFSLEFFPPKTQMGSSNLQARLSRMARALRPLFVTVTWGAGGSTSAKSLELAEICQRQQGLTTCLHLTCTNMNRKLVDEALEEAKALGIRNILALRGDPPRSEEYNIDETDDSNKDFTWAVDLVRYIRKLHGDYFCVGVAGYPEGHADESYPDRQDVEHDLPYLVEKTKAGADFIMTQLTYDIDAWTKYESRLRSHESEVFKTIPIIPGLMPVQSYQILRRITKLSHAKVPPDIMSRIDRVKSDDGKVKKVGVDIVSELVDGICSNANPGPRGLHFYTLNLEKSVSFILERCKLIPPSSPSSELENELESAVITGPTISGINGNHPKPLDRRRASSINSQPHNRVLVSPPPHHRDSHHHQSNSSASSHSHEAVADYASGVPATLSSRHTTLSISEGEGSLGREATWDDYPNGRWGDARSPAFGEIDGYGPSLHVSPSSARKLWGHPLSTSDISDIFRAHLNGKIEQVPWSEATGMNEETATIRRQLLSLIDRGYWTLASQPAVNGVRSNHPIFGWGPPHSGFVFQKPFVEFFVSSSHYRSHLKPHLLKHSDELSFFATNIAGDFEESHPSSASSSAAAVASSAPAPAPSPSLPMSDSSGAVNAVTWGVFRGKEIVTPTIIEEVSFRAWGEEAYGIWEQWRMVFNKGSEEEKFLKTVKEDVWLVNVVGMKFAGGEGNRLWEILME